MRQLSIYLLGLLSAYALAGCSDGNGPGVDSAGPVPIRLQAKGSGLTAVTKVTTVTPFSTTVFASVAQGDYTSLTDAYEWQKDATVTAEGGVSLPNPEAYYPANGAWIYLVAVSPKVESNAVTNGTASYTLTGKEDLLYAQEIRGNKWDGNRFSGNTKTELVTPLNYVHLLTQLTFKAKKHDPNGLAVTIRSITVQKAKTIVSLPLTTGIPAFSGEADVKLELSKDNVITSTTPIPLGSLLLPPLSTGTYQITVETSSGTYKDIGITLTGSSTSSNFGAGVSHEVTLELYDQGLGISSVTVADWTLSMMEGDLEL